MAAELRIGLKIGKVELDFEGSTKTFEEKIEPIVKDLIEFSKQSPGADDLGAEASSEVKSSPSGLGMTVKSIAAKLGGGSGSELLYSAVASLAIIKKNETFTRKDINDEMKQGVGYYKSTYTANLTNYLDGLIKQGVIIETSKDSYAVNESARKDMERRLAQQ